MSALKITNSNFEEKVINESKKVLLDFWASWCGPCRMLAPTIEEIAEERDDIVVGKIDIDEETELAEQFGVMSIPTLVVMQNGEVINRSVGVQPKEQILSMLD